MYQVEVNLLIPEHKNNEPIELLFYKEQREIFEVPDHIQPHEIGLYIAQAIDKTNKLNSISMDSSKWISGFRLTDESLVKFGIIRPLNKTEEVEKGSSIEDIEDIESFKDEIRGHRMDTESDLASAILYFIEQLPDVDEEEIKRIVREVYNEDNEPVEDDNELEESDF